MKIALNVFTMLVYQEQTKPVINKLPGYLLSHYLFSPSQL